MMNLCVGEGVFKFQVIFKSPLILLCSPVFACHPLSGKVLWIGMGAACPPDPLVAVIMGCAVLSCQSCQTLCDHVGCNPPGSFVQDYWCGLPCPPPEDLPKPGLLHCGQILPSELPEKSLGYMAI